MSIQSEITRISGNVSAALTAIRNKGVTVPAGANSDDLADLIAQISGGGGTTRTTIIPEQTVTVSRNYAALSFLSPLVLNETYIYNINGVEYTSAAFNLYGSVTIGTSSIGYIEYYNGQMYFGIEDTSLSPGTYTIKVEQESSGGS